MGDTRNDLDEWVVQAVSGHRSSLDSLLLHFHDPLLRFIKASISLGAAAGVSHEDVFQATIVAAIQALRSGKAIDARGADAFFFWLKTIANNCHHNMINAAKAKKRGGGHHAIARPENADPAATSILQTIAGNDPTPSSVFRRKEAVEAISQAIAKLSPEHRKIIDLHYRSHLSVRELAKEMGKSEDAIRVSIHRILKSLREMLASDFGEFSAGV